jgi:hypothetical protein
MKKYRKKSRKMPCFPASLQITEKPHKNRVGFCGLFWRFGIPAGAGPPLMAKLKPY